MHLTLVPYFISTLLDLTTSGNVDRNNTFLVTVQCNTDLPCLLSFGGFRPPNVPMAFYASDTEVSNAWFSGIIDEDE